MALMDQLNSEVPDTGKPIPEKPTIAKTAEKEVIAPAPEGEKAPATAPAPTEETKTDATPTEEKSDETKEEAPKAQYKIGNVEYATAEDALKEATRIIGRNANLAGDLNRVGKTVDEYKTQLAERDRTIQEALKANKEWEEWAKANANGEERAMPNLPTPDDIAEKVYQKTREYSEKEKQTQAITQEFNDVTALSNWNDVEATIRAIADKVNPLTGKSFSPKEAYRFACNELGLENLLIKKPDTKIAAPATSPKPKDNTVASAAARPTASRGTASAPAQKRDDIDDELMERFR